MNTIRVFSSYQTVSTPHGGANNFIRALRSELEQSHNIVFVEKPSDPYDVLFMNQLAHSPGKSLLSWKDFLVLREFNPQAPLVIRMVNLRSHSYPKMLPLYFLEGDYGRDRNTLALANHADFCIFQSSYQKQFFSRGGYKGKKNKVVHNGADLLFLQMDSKIHALDAGTPLRIFSSSFAERKTKRHDLIAAFSGIPGVEINHAGKWPENLPRKNVNLLGTLTHEQMAGHLKNSHYFLHPAVKDPCPNSLIEALCAGVPVIYNPGPGTGKELGGQFGIALDESDPEQTMRQSRERYTLLAQSLAPQRETFSIRRAAREYAQVFREVLERR